MTKNIDEHIGSKLRLQRHSLGMSQTELGNKLGVTFQQIQKYEKGQNKIVASRLYNASIIMNVDIKYFFDDFENQIEEDSNNSLQLNEEGKEFIYDNPEETSGREAIALIKIYNDIPNKNTRKKLLQFLKSLTEDQF